MPLFGRGRRRYSIGNPNHVPERYNHGRTATGRSLTASGFRVEKKDADAMRRLIQPWQSRAFAYYDQLGEIKYASQFYSRMLANLKLYPAVVDGAGDVVETEEPEAVAALERIQDPGGGRTGLLGSYGRLMFLAGECYLFVTRDPDTDIEQWEMLSTDELRMQGGTYIRYKAPSLVAEEFREPDADEGEDAYWVPVEDRTAVAYRLWQRHPRWSSLADSTMQGVLDLCEELLLLTQAVRARARSRLAGSGILLIDERISPPPLEAVPDEDPEMDPFIAALVDAITKPITDEGAASAVAPITLRVPVPDSGKVSDLIYHLQLIDPTQLYPETGLRYECIKRIAIGLDMPPEILLGMEQSNHWTAWQIDEQTWKGHGQPKAQQLCDDLTQSYFRPYLRDVVGLPNWQDFSIAYDATAVINHPDRTKDAKDLFDRVALSHKALREASGFDEEDAPSEDERAERIGILTRDSSLAWFGTPAPRGGAVETAPGEITSDQVGPDGQPVGGGGGGAATGAEVEAGPPPEKDAPAASNELIGSIVSRVLGATDMALLRTREAAGNRLRSQAKKNPELLTVLNGTRSGMVAHVLGRQAVKSLKINERDLVSGAHELIEDTLRMYDLTDSPNIVTLIASTVEQHAARTLYDKNPAPLPDSFTKYVTSLVVAARARKG